MAVNKYIYIYNKLQGINVLLFTVAYSLKNVKQHFTSITSMFFTSGTISIIKRANNTLTLLQGLVLSIGPCFTNG
jgi:hypothetical protein